MLHTENPKDSLPLIVLLGRLVKAFSPVSGILCHNYGKAWNILMIYAKNSEIYAGTSVQKCLSSLLLISLCYEKIYVYKNVPIRVWWYIRYLKARRFEEYHMQTNILFIHVLHVKGFFKKMISTWYLQRENSIEISTIDSAAKWIIKCIFGKRQFCIDYKIHFISSCK